ncbi:hypothetical protein KIW84_055356 [Lathyrus oleraceus]|uniref:Uncharacterized protein n=1 Tax=Pisum sativum TaxID=3888 RepID=A0A9D5AJP4_PEA|nr:hypothetical protein KIW84_055356 [Pisum sativum]
MEQLASISREHDIASLQEYGGVAGVSNLLKNDLEKGVDGDDVDLLRWRNAFASNNYPRKKGRSFLMFMWDACKNLTLVILVVVAATSLAPGIKSEGIKEGWYDGGSIAFVVILVIVVTTVPADGVVISGYSLSIDESSMTGESKITHKDSKDPFLMSDCKVADGSGTMLVTGVGINTEWGLLMASISEDTGEETPLEVRLNGVATFIGIVGLTVAVIALIVLLARYFSGHSKNNDGTR